MRLAIIGSVMAALGAVTCGARAAIMFSLGQGDYTLQPRQSVVVPVSLEFTDGDATDLTAHGGLLSAAFRVVQAGTPPADPVMPTLLSGNTVDFNDPILTPLFLGPSPTQAGIWEFADLTGSSGVLGQSSAGGRIIPLGQVTFTAGSGLGQTMFQAEAYDPTLQTTVTFNAPSITLDGLIQPSTVTFHVVPEPRTGPVFLLTALILFLPRPRRTGHSAKPRLASCPIQAALVYYGPSRERKALDENGTGS